VKTPEDGYIKAETCSVEKNYSTERIIIIIIAARKTVQKQFIVFICGLIYVLSDNFCEYKYFVKVTEETKITTFKTRPFQTFVPNISQYHKSVQLA
jgi:hypothetical protein